VCVHDPGFESDVAVTADLRALYDVYLGRRTLLGAVREGHVDLAGSRPMVRAFPRWFTGSDFATAVRTGLASSQPG
jgi:hypothetical protein